MMDSPEKILENYIKEKQIKKSSQRNVILEKFLNTEKHLTVNELYELVKKSNPEIGFATVYRAIKVITAAGLAEEIDIGDGIKRYEHKYGHKHHDHLICIKCGEFIEFFDPDIEKLQEKITKKHKFSAIDHKLMIKGICSKCGKE
jgi:Fur family transcriptional regulator, ferric uptake regulator